MKKKILITGSNGFVGKIVTDKLKSDENFEVFETGSSIITNLCNSESVELLPKVDLIVHLAAKSYVPKSFTEPGEFYKNNILSTINILEKARKDSAKVIFISTYVYGRPLYLPIDELHAISPLNPYTQTKVSCEELCKAYQRDFDVPVVVLRPFNIYGPKQTSNFFIPTIFSQKSAVSR